MGGQQSAPVANVPQWVLAQQLRANSPQISGGYGVAAPIVFQQPPQIQRPTVQQQRSRQPIGPPMQQTPLTMGAVGMGAVGTGAAGTGIMGGTVRPAAVGAAPVQISYQAPRPVKQQGSVAGPVTMAQLTGSQKFLGGYFTGGPDDSGICPTSIMFLLILIIIISVAIVLSSYSCSDNAPKAEKPLVAAK